jgi:hypothetical protein
MPGHAGRGLQEQRDSRGWGHRSISLYLSALISTALASWESSPALADISLLEENGTSVTFGLDAAAGYFNTANTNFGTGRIDLRSEENTGDARWAEGYVKPSINGAYNFEQAGKLYGGVAIVGDFTAGDGDAGGYTEGGDGGGDLERLFVGWNSAQLMRDSWGEDALDISYGRQDFHIGDGFLIYDGNLDQFKKGAYWLAPRTAFKQAGLVKINTQPVRGDLFYLKSDPDQDETELGGANIEYVAKDLGTLGITYFHVLDASPTASLGIRDGMDVLSLRATEITLPAAPNLALWGEYVAETGSGRDGKIDANAWYLEARYSFTDWLWSPAVSYRYAAFSGGAVDDATRRDFDPLFYGASDRGWGTWVQGEITGNYLLFNSNQRDHMVHVRVSPSESLNLGLLYYRFFLDKNQYYGTPVTDDHFDDEVNLYADWTINDHLSVSAVYGIAFPGAAAEQVFGDDQPYQLVEVALYLTF